MLLSPARAVLAKAVDAPSASTARRVSRFVFQRVVERMSCGLLCIGANLSLVLGEVMDGQDETAD